MAAPGERVCEPIITTVPEGCRGLFGNWGLGLLSVGATTVGIRVIMDGIAWLLFGSEGSGAMVITGGLGLCGLVVPVGAGGATTIVVEEPGGGPEPLDV